MNYLDEYLGAKLVKADWLSSAILRITWLLAKIQILEMLTQGIENGAQEAAF